MNNAPENIDQTGRSRLYPSLRNPNYLVLKKRREHFTEWLQRVPGTSLRVLDVGGRIQPYRPLLGSRVGQYVAVDLLVTSLVNVRADACRLPFPEASFDLVFCTQVLEYLPEPQCALFEIYRVLKAGGALFASVASFYPHTDNEFWRFLPAGMKQLLRSFQNIEINAEGSSISGFFRSTNVCIAIFGRYDWLREVMCSTVVPVNNLLAMSLERFANSSNNQATGNFSIFAQK